ncbi:uncharacterized protein EV422DRAFT_226305 [Fimicolochytrium jonesii]|uniref:uncharacterized protein n=1 Tax=Fimicolochytrium jonesii TaxID=1396493 RepID=UPI0022FEF17C|nr:uncharacterized protein EV422DRAFT_226305 [Fimicolochytrium jonesii]KAI8817478.1 hypothetical protein EV422DRAFT_226305 [Fimicolochytrium jonesii]
MTAPRRSLFTVVQSCPPLPRLIRREHHSGDSTTTPAWPRTDLNELVIWSSFDDEIRRTQTTLQAIFIAPNFALDIPTIRKVGDETHVQGVIENTILSVVENVAREIVSEPDFSCSIAGVPGLLLDPDFIFASQATPKAKLVGEVKTPWAFGASRNLVQDWHDSRGTRNKTVRAIEQVYGYLTFNNLRYGVLTTYETTWFFKRTCSPQGGRLEVTAPFRYESTPQLIFAYTTIVRLADEHWLHASPTSSPGPASPIVRRRTQPSNPDPHLLQTAAPPSDIHLTQGVDRSRVGGIVRGNYRGQPVIFKTVDVSKHRALTQELDHEVTVYQAIAHLQGDAVVRVIAYVEVWEMLRLLVLEDHGVNLWMYEQQGGKASVLKTKCRECLQKVHATGYLHGDIRLPNFLVSNGVVRLVDFGQAKQSTVREEFIAEMRELNPLFS